MANIQMAGEKKDTVYISRNRVMPDQVIMRGKKDSKVIAGMPVGEESVEASGVTLEISEGGKAKQSDSQNQMRQDDTQWLQKWAQEMYKQQAEAADKNSKAFDDVAKAMEIARRIARGDIVPLKDEKKLIEFSADLYQVAKASAAINANKKHKKYDSLYDEEDDSMLDKMRALKQEDEMANAGAVSVAMVSPPQPETAAGMEQ